MTVDRTDAIHPRGYIYYVSVDEDARRASDGAGAYYLWPESSGLGYSWYASLALNGQYAWQTQYVFESDTRQLWVEDVSASGNQSGASKGVCLNV